MLTSYCFAAYTARRRRLAAPLYRSIHARLARDGQRPVDHQSRPSHPDLARAAAAHTPKSSLMLTAASSPNASTLFALTLYPLRLPALHDKSVSSHRNHVSSSPSSHTSCCPVRGVIMPRSGESLSIWTSGPPCSTSSKSPPRGGSPLSPGGGEGRSDVLVIKPRAIRPEGSSLSSPSDSS